MLILKKHIQSLIGSSFQTLRRVKRNVNPAPDFTIGFITEEFFHEDLRGFGGFGMTVKYITDHFNSNGGTLKAMVCLSTPAANGRPCLKQYHNADVLLRPKSQKHYVLNFARYAGLFNRQDIDVFISIEYYPSYEYILEVGGETPWIVWIKDPRDEEEWSKIATVDLEKKVSLKGEPARLKQIVEARAESFAKMLDQSRKTKRPVYIAAESEHLIEIAERLYRIKIPKYTILPKPMEFETTQSPHFSKDPSFLFIGRLDPIKRPWIYFELAKRFPQCVFYVAGDTHFPEVMNSVIDKYKHIENLVFLGYANEEKKRAVLNEAWAIVNTSIHEGIPVSFVEAFAAGKLVISCQNPNHLTEKFGVYTGEILGNGDDEASLNKFSSAINVLLSRDFNLSQKSAEARKYVAEAHSFETWERNIQQILGSDSNIC